MRNKHKPKSSFESSCHVWRARHRMTQKTLAEKVGVSKATIVQMELGRHNPNLLLAYDIAQVFGVPIEQVFHFTKNEE